MPTALPVPSWMLMFLSVCLGNTTSYAGSGGMTRQRPPDMKSGNITWMASWLPRTATSVSSKWMTAWQNLGQATPTTLGGSRFPKAVPSIRTLSVSCRELSSPSMESRWSSRGAMENAETVNLFTTNLLGRGIFPQANAHLLQLVADGSLRSNQ